MLYPVDWFSGVSHLRKKLNSAASGGSYLDELDETEVADVFRDFARRVDPLDDSAEWNHRELDQDDSLLTVERRINRALTDEIYSHRTFEGAAALDLYLLADDLDPDLDLVDVRRRQWVRSSNRHRMLGDVEEADRLLACMEREVASAEESGVGFDR